MENPRTRVLVIGLDGASFDFIKPWIDKGYLPNFSRIVKKGAYGNLLSTLDFTPPAWSSLYTGKNPGKHGIFNFTRRKSGSYRSVPIDATQRDAKDLWQILSEYGKRVVVLNAPVTYPPRPVNGQFVCGFMTPSEGSNYTYPPELKHELKRVIKGYRIKWPRAFSLGLASEFYVDLYINNIHLNLCRLGDAAIYLANRNSWDFLMVVFNETDNVQHGFWGCMDEDYFLALPARKVRKYKNVILDVYRRIDGIIGQLLNMIDDDTYVVLVSDHGAGPLDKVFHINMFLNKIGLLAFKSDYRTKIKRLFHHAAIVRLLNKIQSSLGLFAFAAILARYMSLSISDVDWSRTKAFSVGAGQIYINKKGREPQGVVEPGKEYDEVRRAVVKSLREVRDSDTGKPVIRDVRLKEELYFGSHVDEAPDIQFFAEETYKPFPWGAIGNELFSRSIEWTGNHTPRGIFAIKGPDVVGGKIDGVSIVDFAPTVLYLMGVPLPSDIDGKVLTSVVTRSCLESRPVTFETTTTQEDHKERAMSRAEEEEIEARLRAMGYLG